MKPITFELPIHLQSTANLREHWSVKARHAKAERYTAGIAALAFRSQVVFPVRVTITRVAPRQLDADNCWASAKHVIDGIADGLGLKNDRDARVVWDVRQERGKPSAVWVEIQEAR